MEERHLADKVIGGMKPATQANEPGLEGYECSDYFHSFPHSLIQRIFTECPVYVRHCSRCWE